MADDNTALIAGCVAAGALLIIIVVSVVVCKYCRGRADEERSDPTTNTNEGEEYPANDQYEMMDVTAIPDQTTNVYDSLSGGNAGYLTIIDDISPTEGAYSRISRDSQGYLNPAQINTH